MAAEGDDLRYWYSETLGDTVQATIGSAGTSTQLRTDALTPGRYMFRIIDFGGASDVWVRQGKTGAVEAAASAPSTRFRAHTVAEELNKPLFTFMVRGGSKGGLGGRDERDDIDNLAIFAVGGTGVVVQVTKISRYVG